MMNQLRRQSSDTSSADALTINASVAPGKQPRTSALPAGPGVVQRKEAPDGAATDAATGSDTGTGADNITIEDVRYEVIAHNFGYRDSLAGAPGELLQSWGYLPEWASKVNDAQTGLFCGLIMPAADHPELTPIVVFRGTQGAADLGDLVADLNPVAVGYDQFHPNKPYIQQMIAEAGGRVNVTGHSLGGALAQHCAAEFTGSVQQVFTFQSPGIQGGAARRANESEDSPETRHHLASGDLVDNAGDQHLNGEFFRHDVGGGPASHVRYLMATPEFASRREEIGLTDEVMAALGIDKQSTQSPVEQTGEYPDPILGGVSEAVRRTVGAGLFPILNAVDALFASDDADISASVANMEPAELAGHPLSERAYMIGRLCRGMTGNRDEDAILTILRAAPSDVPALVDIVGAHKLADNMDGAQFTALMEIYRASYYPRASQDSMLTLLQNCMDGRTSGWEQQIIADILLTRTDGRAIIMRLGAHYEGGGFAEGLDKVQWELTGAQQRRVDAVFAN